MKCGQNFHGISFEFKYATCFLISVHCRREYSKRVNMSLATSREEILMKLIKLWKIVQMEKSIALHPE